MLYLQSKCLLCQQVLQKVEKLVAVLATSTLITDKKKELEREVYIRYPIIFKEYTKLFLESGSKVNIMNQAFAIQLGLKI